MFTKQNNIYTLSNPASVEVEDIEPGVYRLLQHPQGYLYYEKIEDNYELPKKIYGNIDGRAERIMNTWNERTKNTGVLLSGDKGSGKSLLAQILCNKAIEQGAAIILVSSPLCGSAFTDILSAIKRKKIVFIDEFEKIYNREHSDAQKIMLSTMDGSNVNNTLFLLTVNDQWGVDSHMINRPGRIYYHYKYEGLDEEFIRSYCEDILIDKSKIDDIVPLTLLIDSFSFDILKAIVEEINRYGESVSEVLSHLNIKLHGEGSSKDKVTVDIIDPKGNVVTNFYNNHENISTNPLKNPIRWPVQFNVRYELLNEDEDDIIDSRRASVPDTINEDTINISIPVNRETLIDYNKWTGDQVYRDPTSGFSLKISSQRTHTQSIADLYM